MVAVFLTRVHVFGLYDTGTLSLSTAVALMCFSNH